MKAKKFSSRLLAMLLTVMMVLSILSTGAFAEGEGGVSAQLDSDSPIQLKKTATLEDDGTYTIDLEAYVTGEVIAQVEKKSQPTDIILVLDQSGSMSYSMSGLPNGQYSTAGTITNTQAYEGAYYYKVGNTYYPVTVKYASTGTIEKYIDNAGNEYTADQVATTWTDHDGNVKAADGPYLKSSLIPLYRSESGKIFKTYYYVKHDGERVASGSNQTDLRNSLRTKYAGFTVQFDNSNYTAAVYTQLTPIYSHTYEYYYTDAEGNLVAILGVGTSNDSACPHDLYKEGDQNGKRLDVLKYAVNKFVNSVEADGKANGVDHRIAVVGFSSESGYNNTEILSGVTLKTTTASSSDTSYYPDGMAHNGVQYGDSGYTAATQTALQDVTTEAGKASVSAAVDALTAHGATRSDLGMQMAQDILSARTDKSRDAVVIFFTDGEPTSSDKFEDKVAANTINIAKELKIGEEVSAAEQRKDTPGGMPTGVKLGYTAKVYSIAVYNGVSATGSANILGSGATRINDFMHMVSSNYENARGEKQGTRDWEYFRDSGANSGYYMTADSAASLANIFATITNNIHQVVSKVNLGTDTVLRDEMNTGFVLPEGYDKGQITVKTAEYEGNRNWKAAKDFADADITINGNTVDVKNFDYSANVVTEAADEVAAGGKKLIVSISGVLATDEAAENTDVFTNTARSGIYGMVEDEFTLVQAFNRPTTVVGNKSFVLDYAKKAELADEDLEKIVTLDESGMNKFVSTKTSLDMKYGEVEIGKSSLTYTPQTINWDGYDSFYAFGKTAENTNIWSKVSVIPANNVYYEDDFVTSTDDGTVGIEYSGAWTTVGKNAGNTESANTGIHGGWQNTALADDTTYSDGSAHLGEAGATATFTFTGTGVDIYSRTDMAVGTVIAKLEGTTLGGDSVNKLLIVDNESASGIYYQIPTLFFGPLEYGTYTVTLQVTSAGEGDHTYYLDGIRVYNPIQDLEERDETVQDAYGDNIGAEFTSVRDILLESKKLTTDKSVADGVVFIDKAENGTTEKASYDLAEYTEYGPKNEVYLGAGQAIAFKVNTDVASNKYYLGLKAPNGTATKALVTNGEEETAEINISSASDLYYEITPTDDGIIMVKNNGDDLLSITKLQMTGEAAVTTASVSSLIAYADTFDSLPVVTYAAAPADPDPEVTEPEAPAEEPGNVVITEPGGPKFDIVSLLEKIFKGFRGWF